jgi:hypothetical protein
MKEAPQPCTNCPKPCESIYNEDGECWKGDPTQQVSFIEIASKIANTIAEHTEEV